jgi:hypothetical protein
VIEFIAARGVQREAARVRRSPIMQTLMRSAVAKLLDLIELYLNERLPDEPAIPRERSSLAG